MRYSTFAVAVATVLLCSPAHGRPPRGNASGFDPKRARLSIVFDSHSCDLGPGPGVDPATAQHMWVPSLGQLGSPLVPGKNGMAKDGYLPGFQFGHADPSLTDPTITCGHGIALPRGKPEQGEPPVSVALEVLDKVSNGSHAAQATGPRIAPADLAKIDTPAANNVRLVSFVQDAVRTEDVQARRKVGLRVVREAKPTNAPAIAPAPSTP